MKQKKVSSFIKLISKIHQITKETPKHTLKGHQFDSKIRRISQQQHCSRTINFAQGKQHQKQDICERSGLKNGQQNNAIGIYFTEQSIKHRYEDKKNLYDIYRDSLSKKKTNQQTLNYNPHRLRRPQDELSQSNQPAFPMSIVNKLKQRRQSYTYKKIVRKKSFSLSNGSISILPESERKDVTRKLKTDENLDEISIKQEVKESSMREKKLNYKPIFRIKRLVIQNCKSQINPILPVPKVDKINHSKKTINLSTEPVQVQPIRVSFRERIRSKKEKTKVVRNERFSGWQQQRLQQGQSLSRVLM